ncbi:7626_t:CDS:10 [Entrophospora sp. SA101]|nr:7626_t:CDS:10 [Entrophospora sp. SA101]
MTSNLIDRGPGNFRVSIDESVFSALLECAYSDPKHQVLGYLGGKCSIDKFDNNMITCHVKVNLAYQEAIKIFKIMGLVLVGWYRSNISTISNSVITQADITKQQAMQIPHPNAAGIIISISTTGFPSLGPKGQISDGMTNTFYVFRTTENTVISNFETINTSSQGTKPKNGKIWKGKGKELPKTILRESKQVYNGQVLDCENRIGQKVFVDSQYESFLMNFLRKSVVQIDRSVDQDFRSLSFAKYHAKMLINTNGPDTLLGYKLSGHFKEFGITKNEFDLMNEKSETNNESSTNNLAPTTTSVVKESSLSSSSSSTSTAAAIEKRVIRKTKVGDGNCDMKIKC